MKTLHKLVLGAGLFLTGPPTPAQQRADYAGVWYNTDTYTRSVVRLTVNNPNDRPPSLTVWEGLPTKPFRRVMGAVIYRANPDETVPRMVVRLVTADVVERYYLDLQPNGMLWVLHHVARAGNLVRCDTLHFARMRYLGAAGQRAAIAAAESVPTPPEVVLRFAPVGVPTVGVPTVSEPVPALTAFKPQF